MSIQKLLKKVRLTESGVILLGKYIACDGSTIDRPISIISHAHGDHTKQFESALSHCESVLMTPATKDLLIAERGDWLLRRRNLIGLDYKKLFTYEDEKIKLYPVTHMLGACQVLIENRDENRIVYTGDFNYPNTRVLKADVVVLEATYGAAQDVRTHGNEFLINKIVSLTKEELERQKPVYIFAHRGKIQCLIDILNDTNIHVPFLVKREDFGWAQIYKKYGANVQNVYQRRTQEAFEIQRSQQPFVSFHRIGSVVPEAENHLTIRASAWMTKEDFYQPRENYYVVALSDHADFNGLIKYVEKSEAKLVITDGSRSGKAQTLAKEIKEKLDVEAKSLPC